ncbi:hypothetical protein D7X74_02495 [Corallococcus sp. CA047B]|uniref:Ig-like domain-containing protein n=1 Tax=Corallococcus sp. CA047B TaxID=2316729 RepID=UPI000EA1BFB9|nr:Ig-like domain-containing protein [Corallococcus sp. CA047B]RKH20928.1 hypothetical protein D7X74_02495 [Corallococcus sp. CA047B]
MPRLKLLMLLSCVGLAPACIEIPPIEDPVGDSQPDPNADFTLSVMSTQKQVLPGGTLDCEVHLAWAGVKGGDVTLSLLNPPAGIQLQPATLSSGETRAQLSIGVGTSTAAGTYSLTIQGRSGAVTKQATLGVTIKEAGDLVVNWVVPTPGTAYTRGTLLLQFTVEGGSAEAVEILKDASVLAEPTGTPYAFTWDTTQEAEGTYQVSVRATRGGVSFTSAARTVIVDRTAPTVSSFLPARNATNVGVNESIQVTFSEPMDPRSMRENAVYVTTSGGAYIQKSASVSADGRTLTLKPLEPVVAPETVDVTLDPGTGLVFEDLAGNILLDTPTWSFSVPAWLPLGGAISANEGKTSAEDVVLKMDRNNQPVVAWSESDGNTKSVYVARWTGNVWNTLGAPLSGLLPIGTDATHPTLVIDSSNRPVVSWQEAAGDGMTRDIFSRRWMGASWEALPTISIPKSGGSDYLGWPALALDETGTLRLYANHQNEGLGEIRAYELVAGGPSWSASVLPVPSNYIRAETPSASIANSDAYVAYSILDLSGPGDGTRGIGVARNGSLPLGNQLIGRLAFSPSIAVDSNGRPWVTWIEVPTGKPSSEGLAYWTRWEGNAWTSPAAVSGAATGDLLPVLSMSIGSPHVLAWSGIINSERSIHVRRWTSNQWQSIGQPLNALTETATPAFAPSIAMDSDGQPVVAWTEESALSASVYVYRLNH